MGVLVSSSEVPELLLLCDRIAVMFRGRVSALLSRDEASEATIALYAGGTA
jgi:ABC-type sugar transport system ATPase subunit